MFTAQILAVMISGPIILTDTRGPYVTKQQCQARITEMVETIQENMPVVSIQSRCVKDDSEGTAT